MVCEPPQPPRPVEIVLLPGRGRRTVCWLEPDGREGRGSPLPPPAAEDLLALYRRRHPERSYWLEDEGPL